MKILIIIATGALLIGAFFLFSSPVDDDLAVQDESETISYASVMSAVDEGATFLDVRTPEEFYESHYVRAELFPLQRLQRGELPIYDKDETLYVYCRTGNRTQEASAILRQAGYTVVDLGGLEDVRDIGGELNPEPCPLGEARLCVQRAVEAGNI